MLEYDLYVIAVIQTQLSSFSTQNDRLNSLSKVIKSEGNSTQAYIFLVAVVSGRALLGILDWLQIHSLLVPFSLMLDQNVFQSLLSWFSIWMAFKLYSYILTRYGVIIVLYANRKHCQKNGNQPFISFYVFVFGETNDSENMEVIVLQSLHCDMQYLLCFSPLQNEFLKMV